MGVRECYNALVMSSQLILPITIPDHELKEFCRKWQITELSLFGSVLRDDFGPESDIDLLAVYAPEARHSLFDLDHMEAELRQIFGRNVDLVSKKAVEASENYLRRKEILRSAHVIYDSRSGVFAGHAPGRPTGAELRAGA